MSRKEAIKLYVTLVFILCPIVQLIIVFYVTSISGLEHNNKVKIESIEESVKNLAEDDDSKTSIYDFVYRKDDYAVSVDDMYTRPEIKIKTPHEKYEFTDMELTCSEFSTDNELWYSNTISPYISPGVSYDLYLLGDRKENHYIKMHVINTGEHDVSASECKVFSIGISGIEGYSIDGISIGDDLSDVIKNVGVPDSFSISDYDIISGATYDKGDYEINIVADVLVGKVKYIEVICKNTKGYDNGRWR